MSGGAVGDDLVAALVVQLVVPNSEVLSGILISGESPGEEMGFGHTVGLHGGGHLRRHGGGSVCWCDMSFSKDAIVNRIL